MLPQENVAATASCQLPAVLLASTTCQLLGPQLVEADALFSFSSELLPFALIN